MKVILDFVPNHTSDQHPWFVESRSSRDNPKRDWYIWRDPAPDGGPPNNWLSNFGGRAWEFDEATGQYYYHAFLQRAARSQLAQSRRCAQAMLDVLRFWLERGVDGFRVDVIWHLDQGRRSSATTRRTRTASRTAIAASRSCCQSYNADRPEVHDDHRAACARVARRVSTSAC